MTFLMMLMGNQVVLKPLLGKDNEAFLQLQLSVSSLSPISKELKLPKG